MVTKKKLYMGEIFANVFQLGGNVATIDGKEYKLPNWQTAGTYSQCNSYVNDVVRKLRSGDFKISGRFIHVQ